MISKPFKCMTQQVPGIFGIIDKTVVVSKPEPGTRWPGPFLESAVPVITGYVTIVVEVTYRISMCAYVCICQLTRLS